MQLWKKSIIGMLGGILCGVFLRYYHCEYGVLILNCMEVLSTLYTNALKMMIIPVVFFAVLFGIVNTSDIQQFKKVGLKAIAVCVVSAIISSGIGLSLGIVMQPGSGVSIQLSEEGNTSQNELGHFIGNIIPSNPFEAMCAGNTLQVVVFAFIIGIGILLTPHRDEAKKFVIVTSQILFKVMEIVMNFAPYGVFAIILCMTAKHGYDVLHGLGKLSGVILVGLCVQYVVFLLAARLIKIKPFRLQRKLFETQMLAFSTSSSKACIVKAIDLLQHKLGVSSKIANFILPLSTSVNMSAISISLSISALFFAQALGMTISTMDYCIIVLTSTLGAIGGAGIPSGTIVMMSLVLSSVGISASVIPLLIGFDRVLDMCRTVINITGDIVLTLIMAKIEGELDLFECNKSEKI
ncbi:Putative proton glutamate symport protein [Candidatus Fokinia solitaria]|uniref:Proton glutamate symport protein n=1 Tax=Candidatus Fokinia solitaria TaxID=1802984 RepID=A0A2U8BS40_9RICK|nr:dicarboxylate/amino acid:cation symporter [Candidatus Fokinia solitaria]AWD33125.1 Putative proton glutamate symport protein [Candidatus Fokinia solitaria]